MDINHDSVTAAMAVLDRFMAAFSASDEAGVRDTFNFPHVRFHGGKVTMFINPEDYNMGFFQGTADAKDWAKSVWDERSVINAGADKVHFDTKFSRLRADGSVIATYRSIYIVTKVAGKWGIQGRSSFAP